MFLSAVAAHMKESNDTFCIGAVFLIRAMLRCTFKKIKLFFMLLKLGEYLFICILAVRFSFLLEKLLINCGFMLTWGKNTTKQN